MTKSSPFTQQEISKLIKQARRYIKHPGLDILLAPTSGQEGRILVITPRAIGNAPQRNKIRRRLKALFSELGLSQQGLDCIVIVKKEGVLLDFDALKILMLKAFKLAKQTPQL